MKRIKTLFMLAAVALLSLITACGVFAEVDATTPSQFLAKLKAAESYTISMVTKSGEYSMTQTVKASGGKYHFLWETEEDDQSSYLEKVGDNYYYYELDNEGKWEKTQAESEGDYIESMMFIFDNDSSLWENTFDNDKYTYNANDKKYTLKAGKIIVVDEDGFTNAALSFTKTKITILFVIEEFNATYKIEFTNLNATAVTLPVIE